MEAGARGRPEENWYVRLAGTTRGRIVGLLRRRPRTVNELAEALGVTDNAVRNHLAVLGRERLVVQRGVRRGTGGKPAHVYGLTAEAEELFPKAYATILGGLLDALSDRLGAAELEALLRRVGREAAGGLADDGGDLRGRTETAAGLLEELGGAVRIEETEAGFRIQGASCPMPALVPDHPELCRLAEALVSAVVGAEVRECCDRTAPPRCAFRVVAGPGPGEAPAG